MKGIELRKIKQRYSLWNDFIVNTLSQFLIGSSLQLSESRCLENSFHRTGGAMDLSNDRGRQLVATMAGRHVTAALDHDGLNRLLMII